MPLALLERPFIDFAASRNELLAFVSERAPATAWVLLLDANEELHVDGVPGGPPLCRRMAGLASVPHVTGLLLERRWLMEDGSVEEHLALAMVRAAALWPRAPDGYEYSGPVHEVLTRADGMSSHALDSSWPYGGTRQLFAVGFGVLFALLGQLPLFVARIANTEADATPLEEDCLFAVVVNGTLGAAQISAISNGLNAALVNSDGPTLAHGQVAESGLIAGIVLGVLVLALAILGGCAWWRWKPRPLRIFLSYRVNSDKDLAQTLFERLTEEGIDVWCAAQ